MKFNNGDKVVYRTLNKNGTVILCVDPNVDANDRFYYVKIKNQIWSCPEKKLLKIVQ